MRRACLFAEMGEGERKKDSGKDRAFRPDVQSPQDTGASPARLGSAKLDRMCVRAKYGLIS